MKNTQRLSNLFAYTDSNKRYHTFDYHMKMKYGGKCVKIPLNAGFTCPNIDGTKGVGGCIYCSGGGSGSCGPIEEQYAEMRAVMGKKWSTERCIPYLQANTNTYADTAYLRELYTKTANLPDAVEMNISTRADCIDEEKTALIAEISKKLPVTVELGLQTIHDSTAGIINRCHTFHEFSRGYNLVKNAGERVSVCVHLINGLPGEDEQMMLKTAAVTASLKPDQVKIHLLHVLRGTALEEMYRGGLYEPMTMSAYVNTVCSQLELFAPQTVIGRLTGDGIREELISPEWSLKKRSVLNNIDKELFRRNTYQGIYFKE